MFRIKWAELFPSKLSVFIFFAYMALFVNLGILVTASQNSEKKYNYNTTLVVLLTEVLKLFASAALYCKNEKLSSMLYTVYENKVLLAYYMVPSLLYCFYNNLSFVNLITFDPTTYYLLLQFRVVITAILFQIIFKKNLSGKQWSSLVMLTIGCMIKHVDSGGGPELTVPSGISMARHMMSFSAVLILVQGFCSSLAGVYNEYLLKSKGSNVDIFIQNIFMYLDSIFCNVLIIAFQGRSEEIFSVESFQSVLQVNVVLIMINSAIIGVVTSFFLKTMNSIVKTFASAIELIFTALACYLIFGIVINIYTVLSILIVSISVIMYSQSPIDNQAKTTKTPDQLHLLEEGGSV